MSTRGNVHRVSIYAAYINLPYSKVLLMLQAFLTRSMSLIKKKKQTWELLDEDCIYHLQHKCH